ncbi:MAG: Oligopeptide transport ATP-binding protein OppF [Frondihabitans sp.]|nr:Oligopeptide transport ATP-binding protein OppF [Frondihabitans sp.]
MTVTPVTDPTPSARIRVQGTPAQLVAHDITRVYVGRGSSVTAVEPLDFSLDPKSAVGIIGESGSGKSTLSRILVGLETPTTGSVTFNGTPIQDLLRSSEGRREFRSAVQYVAQDTSSSFDPRRTLGDAVATPLRVLRGVTGQAATDRLDEIASALRLDPAFYSRLPSAVSGGQRQRFALARALVVRPRILLCDEVVSALDVSVQGAVLNLIKDYVHEHDIGLAFVSHGLPATAFISDELVIMRNGHVVERGTTESIVLHAKDDYTRSLLAAYRKSGGRS